MTSTEAIATTRAVRKAIEAEHPTARVSWAGSALHPTFFIVMPKRAEQVVHLALDIPSLTESECVRSVLDAIG